MRPQAETYDKKDDLLGVRTAIETHPVKLLSFVETGTADGTGILEIERRYLGKPFKNLLTIEKSLEMAERYRDKFEGSSVLRMLGDSRDVLPTWGDQLGPTLWYLDAHYCRGYHADAATNETLPLFRELEILSWRTEQDVVVVDDAGTFQQSRDDLRREGRGWGDVTFSGIEKLLKHVSLSYRCNREFILHLNCSDTWPTPWLSGSKLDELQMRVIERQKTRPPRRQIQSFNL